MKSVALDTNVAIDVMKQREPIRTIATGYNKFYLPVAVISELLYGDLNGFGIVTPQLRRILADSTPIEADAAVANRYARIRLHLKRQGQMIPMNDLWIAASCIEEDVPLLTRDGHFGRVPGLRLAPLDPVGPP